MSSTNTSGGITVSGTALIWAIVAMFIATVGGVVILAVALPESQNPAALAGQLLGSFALLLTGLGTLFTVQRARKQVEQVAQDTAEIRDQTNGKLDARIHTMAYAAMTQALEDRLTDDDPLKRGNDGSPRNKAYAAGLAPKPAPAPEVPSAGIGEPPPGLYL